jgi:phospholipase/lecithinase/hemolysin
MRTAVVLISLLLGSTNSLASELETITVSGQRLPDAYGNQAVNTAVISQEELALLGATHIYESLTRAPGTWVNRGNGQEHLTALRSPVLTVPVPAAHF